MMYRLLALLTLVTCLSEAHAEWFLEAVEDTTFATLARIDPGDDKNVPEADIYVISSPGGYLNVAVSIAMQLKGKPVMYTVAMSAGALIVDMTGATPAVPTAVKGYHWSRPAPENNADPLLQAKQGEKVDKFIVNCIFDSYRTRYAARIVGLLADLPADWMVVDVYNGDTPTRMSPEEINSIPLIAKMSLRYNWNI